MIYLKKAHSEYMGIALSKGMFRDHCANGDSQWTN